MTQDSVTAISHTPATPATPAQGATAVASVGHALRSLRTAKGWSLEEVSSRIKFSPRQIRALEEEQWADLPTGVSLRGLIRNYARLLGADPNAIVASLDPTVREPGRASLRHATLHSSDSVPSAVDEERSSSSWGWIIAILIVVAAAVAYAFAQGWLPRQWLSFDWFSSLNQ